MREPFVHAVDFAEPIPFDDACQILAMPSEEVARLLLSGTLAFTVDPAARPRIDTDDVVRTVDLSLDAAQVRAYHEYRWRDPLADVARADAVTNRAALKFDAHPTRTGPGVRGRGRKNRGADLD